MIKKNLLIILAISLNVSAETSIETRPKNICSIELFSKVYRLETNQTLGIKDVLYKTDCDITIINRIVQLISNSSGTVGADFLKRELAKDFNTYTVDINPRKLSLLDLNTTLRDELTSGSNLYFLNSKSLNGIKTLGLIEGEQLKVNCENCTNYGEKNIKLDIATPLQGTTRSLWFSSVIMSKIKIFKAKRTLNSQQSHLEVSDFYPDEILSSAPDNVLTTLNNIEFYKVNKTIPENSVISNLDLQSINLINFGTPVTVILKNQNINLQKTAMPSRSALFGEIIELKNPNTSKIMAGKVVDYNKVVIEL